ncbi:uncharacterized protein LOC142340534 isoform X4 [Convolutriloba macropyga]|uniref:uncharacterized protein LOC142340534 isoform X4 n=1 Tax=Convolutriloba macropyga TaxID=536237 RepID=UPI003F51CE9B
MYIILNTFHNPTLDFSTMVSTYMRSSSGGGAGGAQTNGVHSASPDLSSPGKDSGVYLNGSSVGSGNSPAKSGAHLGSNGGTGNVLASSGVVNGQAIVASACDSSNSSCNNSQTSADSPKLIPQYCLSGDDHSGEKLSKTNLYIRGLSENTTDAFLVDMCKSYGQIVSTKAILDKNTNLCKGYGFVDFAYEGEALKAVVALQNKGVLAQMARQQEQDPTNLYISNLPRCFDEKKLEKLLKSYGHVISTRILRDNSTQSKGVGFARMESKEICEHIIDKLNGNPLPPSCAQNLSSPVDKEPLLVKFADTGKKKKPENKFRNGEEFLTGLTALDPSILTPNGFCYHSIANNRMAAAPVAAAALPLAAANPAFAAAAAAAAFPHHLPLAAGYPSTSPTGAALTAQGHPLTAAAGNGAYPSLATAALLGQQSLAAATMHQLSPTGALNGHHHPAAGAPAAGIPAGIAQPGSATSFHLLSTANNNQYSQTGLHLDQSLLSSAVNSNGALMTTTTSATGQQPVGQGVMSPTMANGNVPVCGPFSVPVSTGPAVTAAGYPAGGQQLAHQLAHQMNQLTMGAAPTTNGLGAAGVPHGALGAHNPHTAHYHLAPHWASTGGYMPLAATAQNGATTGASGNDQHQHLALYATPQAGGTHSHLSSHHSHPHLQMSLEDHLKQQQLNGLVTTVVSQQQSQQQQQQEAVAAAAAVQASVGAQSAAINSTGTADYASAAVPPPMSQ